ncbi:MAG: NUDIX domain-containing protein [Spirochaetales bacterium]|nr:NUDIX domain-containing protein [Spirochaetales bacterium]
MIEYYERKNRRFGSEWLREPFRPPRELTIQASGICFTKDEKITLVRHGKGWLLPGGFPEKNETLEQALIREIKEEACARVLDFRYLGSIKSHELHPVHGGNMSLFYQARYWVLVENGPFDPQFEIEERIEIHPGQFVGMLRWPAKKLAKIILDDALIMKKKMLRS